MLTKFFASSLLGYLLPVFTTVLFALAIVFYFRGKKNFRKLVYTALIGRFLYTALLTFGQYYMWSQSSFTRLLLNQGVDTKKADTPLFSILFKVFGDKVNYFFVYSWGRFWLNFLLILLVAWMFWLLLKALHAYKDSFFEEGELQLGLLCALLVGWPNIFVFIPVLLFSVVIISIIRLVWFQEAYTTMGLPFIIAAALTLLFGNYLAVLLGISILQI